MNKGELQQVDTPLALYDTPVNRFVAGFIWSPAMNFLEGESTAAGVLVAGTDYTVPVACDLMAKARSGVTVGVRPEAWHLAETGEEGLPVKVTVVEELGAEALRHGNCGLEVIQDQVRYVRRVDIPLALRGCPHI